MHGDVRWKLMSQQDATFKAGEYATIQAINGNKLVVTKKKEGK